MYDQYPHWYELSKAQMERAKYLVRKQRRKKNRGVDNQPSLATIVGYHTNRLRIVATRDSRT